MPIKFADSARSRGETVVAFALKGITSEELVNHVDKILWFEWGDLTKAIFSIAKERVKKAVMLGKVKKELIFNSDEKFDEDAKKIASKDRKDYTILNNVAKALRLVGCEIISPSEYLADLIPAKGILTKRAPTKDERADVDYGIMIAREMTRFDIGQTVVVKAETVIALEAVEGTDETIGRAAGLTKGGFAVVKIARPDQDMRFDIPLIGIETLKRIIEGKGAILALEAGKTLLMDREEVISLADQNGISIIAV